MTEKSAESVIKILTRERILLASEKRRIKARIALLRERRRRQELILIRWRQEHSNQHGVWDKPENKAFARTLYEQYGNLGYRIKKLGGDKEAKTGRREFESG
ncbi:MAG TPA: hypothetical protein VNA15_08375 [Candidatus Angelobacter sp.]|nr:hypothetical protein [Candidatus Angelobacter sp.]